MKKVGLLFMVVLVATVIVGKVSRQGEVANELLMSNIEALAANEDIHYTDCAGSGSVDCPDGTKVAYVLGLYNLE